MNGVKFSVRTQSESAHAKIESLLKILAPLRKIITLAQSFPEQKKLIYQGLKWHIRGLIEEEIWNSLLNAAPNASAFRQATLAILASWKTKWLTDIEYTHLYQLAHNGNLSLVFSYLDLQRGTLSDISPLEQALGRYAASPEKSDFPDQIEKRHILQGIYSWFVCMPAELNDWENSAAFTQMQISLEVNLIEFLERPRAVISNRKKLFMEEFLHTLQQQKNRARYLEESQKLTDELDLWEEVLLNLNLELKKIELGGYRDQSLISVAFAKFEEALISFQHEMGQLLAPILRKPLTDIQQAIKIGNFRLLFQELNNSISQMKTNLLGKASHDHYCCCCHLSPSLEKGWPLNNRVLDLPAPISTTIPKSTPPALLIFTCGGGNGHLSAARAITQAVDGQYHVLIANTLEETLAPNDILRRFKFNLSQEKLYNYLLKNEIFELLSLMSSCGPFVFMMMRRHIEKLVRLEILKQNPRVLISCMPIFNSMFLNIAKELNLPLIIVTTDLDCGEFIQGMSLPDCDINYPNYYITMAYENPKMRSILEKKIPKEKIKVIGFPLRNGFFEEISENSLDEVRKFYSIKNGERLVLVMMGGNAGLSIEKYAKLIADYSDGDLDEKIHVLCFCGTPSIAANKEMLEKINALKPKSSKCRIQATYSTNKIPELMTLAHAIISKPGGCTTNEALSKKLPIIFHAPFALMGWEKFNMQFCLDDKMGFRFHLLSNTPKHFSPEEIVYNKRKLLPLIKQAFQRCDELRNGDDFPYKTNFHQNFLKLLEEIPKPRYIQ